MATFKPDDSDFCALLDSEYQAECLTRSIFEPQESRSNLKDHPLWTELKIGKRRHKCTNLKQLDAFIQEERASHLFKIHKQYARKIKIKSYLVIWSLNSKTLYRLERSGFQNAFTLSSWEVKTCPVINSVCQNYNYALNIPVLIFLQLDISLESTMLSPSCLDENGLVKNNWNHNYFVPDIGFSDVATLKVKNSFITNSSDFSLDMSLFGTEDDLRDIGFILKY
ncbi:hypothetical protein BDF21DRAFT_401580 [Thamnidium elegans]|nr:hypothetical protein BDF21DRAFT_401580 [Thamnidium elegans]